MESPHHLPTRTHNIVIICGLVSQPWSDSEPQLMSLAYALMPSSGALCLR